MAKDLYHEQVKRALEKDGWQITHDPYELRIGGVEINRPLRFISYSINSFRK
ncbi:element excision factor XisH family protein [Nostoc sp.]|uniref:element excision factor XisH family protein n=1 Tax=Nostoc sp. TaxID=1180 RepID=UPI002FF51EF0